MMTPLQQNACDLEQELVWFARVLDTRFKLYFGHETTVPDVFAVMPPDLSQSTSPYATFVQHYQLSFAERTALVLSLISHIRPQLLDIFFTCL